MLSEHPPASVSTDELEAAGSNYGDVPLEELQSKAISCRSWTDVVDLDEAAAGRSVLIRGSAQAIRKVSKKMAFVVLRQRMSTVQCVLHASDDASMQMVQFAASLSKESIVDVQGVVSIPGKALKATTQQVSNAICAKCWFLLTSVFSSSLNLPLQFNMDGHVA
jgi:aspartyl-tRNA synthetase